MVKILFGRDDSVCFFFWKICSRPILAFRYFKFSLFPLLNGSQTANSESFEVSEKVFEF